VGADTLVSIGGDQSNHTRQVAALAAKLGLEAGLVPLEDVGQRDGPPYAIPAGPSASTPRPGSRRLMSR
jgi:hypothetical protein